MSWSELFYLLDEELEQIEKAQIDFSHDVNSLETKLTSTKNLISASTLLIAKQFTYCKGCDYQSDTE
jgi:hypothetical protein